MKPDLIFSRRSKKFKLLENVYINIDSKKNRNIFSQNGVKNIQMMITCMKIFFMSKFFDYPISRVIENIKNDKRLKHFMKIHGETPTEGQVYEYLSRYSPETYNKIANSFFKLFSKTNKRKISRLIVDATPVECDINIIKEYVTPERLEKLDLNFGYSTTKGHFIGFKVTVVLEEDSLSPISVLIHSGAKNDSKIYDEVLEELKRRRLLKEKQEILFDKGYFSYDNYIKGINEYHIVPIIFPRGNFKLSKLEGRMSTRLDIFKDKNTLEAAKKLYLELTTKLYKYLENWKDLKPIRGIIEDFFKVGKDAFGLGKFHSYTQKSMRKNIYLCILLTAIVVQQGFNTKTKLQQLAEGRIDKKPIKSRKAKKSKKDKEKPKVEEVVEEMKGQTRLPVKIVKQSNLEFFA